MGRVSDRELAAIVRGIAPAVREVLRAAVAGLVAKLEPLEGLTPRVLALESRAAVPGPPGPAGADGRDGSDAVALAVAEGLRGRLEAAEARLQVLEGLRERVAVAESRAGVPGPPGADGRDGLGFEDLAVEFDGVRTLALTFTRGSERKVFPLAIPFLRHAGVYREGAAYEPGDVVTWAGSMWHCFEATTTKPGDGAKAWQLIVKRGRDGKDGREGPVGPVGPAGKDWEQLYEARRSR